jgi:hypothetical protein
MTKVLLRTVCLKQQEKKSSVVLPLLTSRLWHSIQAHSSRQIVIMTTLTMTPMRLSAIIIVITIIDVPMIMKMKSNLFLTKTITMIKKKNRRRTVRALMILHSRTKAKVCEILRIKCRDAFKNKYRNLRRENTSTKSLIVLKKSQNSILRVKPSGRIFIRE